MFPFKKPPSKIEVARQTVSDAAQHLLDAVPTEKIEEKLDDLKKSAAVAALHAIQAAHHASELAAHKIDELQNVASHLSEGVSKSAHGAVQNAVQSAAQTAQSAAKSAQTAGQSAAATAAAKATSAAQSARESAQAARENLGEKAATLRESVGDSAGAIKNLKERAAHDFKIGSQEAQNAKEAAQKAAQREAQAVRARAEAAQAKVGAKQAQIAVEIAQKAAIAAEKEAQDENEKAQQAKNLAADAASSAKAEAKAAIANEKEEAKAVAIREKQELKDRAARVVSQGVQLAEALPQTSGATSSEIKIAESGSKWAWILIGLAIGAVLAILFAPTTGRRSRAAIKDRLGKVSEGAIDAATATSDKVVDIAQRVEGLAHKAEAKLSADSGVADDSGAAGGENDDDSTIADRVRSVLGHHEVAKTLDRLNIDCADGVVTLRGPMLDDETQRSIVAAVSEVPGVKAVVSDFLVDEEPSNPADSQI